MSLQALLAELQQSYLAALPGKAVLIEQLWQAGNLVDLETEYHKLKGTGRTYGLPEITQVGEALERICECRHASLAEAVPLSIRLITELRQQRINGEAPKMDESVDFQKLVKIVEQLDRA